MANKPNIRFKGFTDDWEQRKLGELVSFSKGSGYSKGDLKENGTPIILYGRLYTKYETVISEVDTFVDARENSVYSKGGEVIVPGSGENAEDISIASVVKKSGVLLGGDLNIITPPKDIDAAFLAISISNGKSHNDMAKMAQGKSVVHLHNSDLAKIDFSYPSYQEQCKISRSFSQIDHLITLHQRKCDETKKIKKYMLQKMFPKNGEKNPEIRFAGFTDDWEQRKLGEIVQIIMGQSPSGSTYSNTPSNYILVQGNADLYNGWVSPRVWTSQKTKEADAGDLIMSVRAPAGAMGKTAYNVVIGRGVAAIKGNEFIYQLLVKMDTDGYWKALSCGSTFESLNSDNIKNADVIIPKIAEQKKIGEYFSTLDHLITLHQRKCDKLKLIKKFMLQNMFPKKG